MSVLLDTHVVLWWLADSPKLSPQHRAQILDTRQRVFVSAISVAEVSIKSSLGKLNAPEGIADAVSQSGLELLAFDAAHAEELRHLPWHHRDPFDRMLVAQARVEKLTLLTVDDKVMRYF